MQEKETEEIKAIIGLGNPGPKFHKNRHNIGFLILDELAQRYNAQWKEQDLMDQTQITIAGNNIFLIKPQTYMNDSGKVIPWLLKKGIKAENILVVHDELELPFGAVKCKVGGSARGHNGLRSIIQMCGPDFQRLRFGIDRPEQKEQVSSYVLTNFSEPNDDVEHGIEQAADLIKKQCGFGE